MVSALMLSLLGYVHADTKRGSKDQYQTATVVSVDKHVAESHYLGSPTDALLQAEDYSYDIGIRLDCNIYVGRYESAIDYLRSAFATQHAVGVRLQKHILYVSLPDNDRGVKMGIASHRLLKGNQCTSNNQRRICPIGFNRDGWRFLMDGCKYA